MPIKAVQADPEKLQSEELKTAALSRAQELLLRARHLKNKDEANALADEINRSLATERDYWECLRRVGFLEIPLFWHPKEMRPTIISSLREKQADNIWTDKLVTAFYNWHARLGYSMSVWIQKESLSNAKLQWLRREIDTPLRSFRQRRGADIITGDALSLDSFLVTKAANFDEMQNYILDYLHSVVNCGMANIALYTHEKSDNKHLILKVYGISRDNGRGYFFYFDASHLPDIAQLIK